MQCLFSKFKQQDFKRYFKLQKGGQRVSKMCIMVIGLMMLSICLHLYLTIMGSLEWLDWLYFLAVIKLIITLFKYMPQAYLNYSLKSTRGWAIGTSLFDLLGGVFSTGQMFLIAWDHNDWGSLLGNIAKLGLGTISIFFDIVFIVQHFCLYTDNDCDIKNSTEEEEENCLLMDEISSEESLSDFENETSF